MRIVSIADAPFWAVPYRTAAPRGTTQAASLPLVRATVDRLPAGVAAVVACSDLQGREALRADGQVPRLLGEGLADELVVLAEAGELPATASVGVLLVGDLYADPAVVEMGRQGDVSPVWHAFADRFRWVVGVAGNHDVIDGLPAHPRGRAHLLDGDWITVDDMRIGGVSGIVGDVRKGRPWRRSVADFMDALRRVLAAKPDVLLLHQGPEVAEAGLPGHPAIRPLLDADPQPLTLCGHVRWPTPLATLPSGGQVLNVDARVVVLRQAG